MLCILRLGNQVGSYFGPNFGCYGSLLAKIGVPILPKLVPVCQVGCPTSRSNYDPNRIQTVSKPYPNHIRPSYQQSLGGSFVAKISPFWASSDHKWGCPISNLSKDHWYPMLDQVLQKFSNFWQFFCYFWALLVILKLQHWPPANCYALCQSNWESFLGQLHTKLVLTIWLGHPATHSIPDMGYYKSVI